MKNKETLPKKKYKKIEKAFIEFRGCSSKPLAYCFHEEAIEFANWYSNKQNQMIHKASWTRENQEKHKKEERGI